ncbi:TetR/AcrR family transcriptional regulator [Promicromonospora sp. Populi]|uniref:TetR/AcrR family transcriptional regulator n=1 Tax=Promicromonospora sp. Populi TaxID=3239420 RepID=UPI0034E21E79
MAEPQTLRADARRNRDQIVAAAKVLFAERGPDAPMEEIARQAGVGVGTLYRRFPDREALIQEVARDSLAVLVAHAQKARAEGGQGWESFLKVLETLPELWFTLRLTILSQGDPVVIRHDPQGVATGEQLVSTLDDLVRDGQEAGTLRADVSTADMVMLITLVISGLRSSSGALPDAAHARMLALGLDGLRATAHTPLPGRPLDIDEIGGKH